MSSATLLSQRRARGFTLVEAMVALVVLAVGMLGIAGLYVTTLRSGGGAIYRMQAVNLAADLADRSAPTGVPTWPTPARRPTTTVTARAPWTVPQP